ncbi:MAG: [protein-PII] uridylyltransferase family protein [Parvularcula sp.]
MALRQDIRRCVNSGQDAAGLAHLLRAHWEQATAQAFSAADKADISLRLSDEMDQIVSALAENVCPPEMSVVAVGGYGRGRLAPYSDIDLLFLTQDKPDQERLLPMLHAMWDAEIGLSQMVHTVRSAIAAADQDIVTRTSFLDARFLIGNIENFDRFQAQFDLLRKRTIKDFVDEKLKERDGRHARSSGAIEIEPNIKESRGGLRDLDTLHWIDRYISGEDEASFVVAGGRALFTRRERRRLNKLVDFFWMIRVHLHRLVQRPDDRLYFELQSRLAEAFGYHSHAGKPPVEAFMRYYFLCAKEVIRLTDTTFDMLRHYVDRKGAMASVGEVYARMTQEYPFGGESNLVRRWGRVTYMDHARAMQSKRELFALFRVAAAENADIDPDALKTVSRGAKALPPQLSYAVEASGEFLQILHETEEIEKTLRLMTDVGLLGRLLPGFGGCIGVVEYGLYRQFTVEEHILRSVGVLSDMLHDRDDGRYKISKPLAKAFGDPTVILLALLLQETEMGLVNPSKEQIDQRVLDNIGGLLSEPEDIALVQFAVSQKHLLTRAAVRRNVHDPHLIATIARQIPSKRHLSLLAIIAACKHATAGHHSWEEYAKRDIRSFVDSLSAYMDGGMEKLFERIDERDRVLKNDVRDRSKELSTDEFNDIWARMGHSFWPLADAELASSVVRLVSRVDRSQISGGAIVLPHARQGLRVICYFEDRPGMFADCAGLAASLNASIFDALAFDLTRGARRGDAGKDMAALVLNLSFDDRSEPPDRRVLEEMFAEVACGEGGKTFRMPSMVGDRRSAFSVSPSVRSDLDASDEALVVEIETLDRTGLLFELAQCFLKMGLSIHHAYIATYGHRAVDSFYLKTADGQKPTAPELVRKIEARLEKCLQAPDMAQAVR